MPLKDFLQTKQPVKTTTTASGGSLNSFLQKNQPTKSATTTTGGSLKNFIQGGITKTTTPATTPTQQKQPEQKTNFFKEVVKGITKPFVRAGTTAYQLGHSTLDLAKGDVKGSAEALKPIPSKFYGELKPYNIEKPLDIVGSGADIALTIGSGGSATALKAAGKEVAKEGIKGVSKEAVKLVAKNALKDFFMGATSGTAVALEEGKKPKEVIGGALTGGVASTILTPLLGGALKIGIKGTSALSKQIGKGVEKVATKLEQKAIPETTNLAKGLYYEGTDKAIQTTGQKIAGTTAEVIRSVQKIPQKISTEFLDKYTALKKFTSKAKAAGIDTPDLQDMAQSARYKATGTAENKLDDYLALRSKYGEDWQNVKLMSHYLDDLDRLARDNKIPGGRTIEDVQKDMTVLTQRLGNNTGKIQQGQKELQTFLNQELLDSVDSGRISPESFKAIKAAHPNYIPHDVLDFLDEEQIGKGMGKSFNLSKSGIEKAQGSVREIDDIDNAVVNRLARQSILNEKNKTVKAVIDIGKQIGEGGGFVKLEQTIKPVDIPAGFEKISYFNNGVKEDWLIPDDVGRALKNLDGEQVGKVMTWLDNSTAGKIITAPAKFIRKTATTLNPVFALFRNPARDIQTAMVTAPDDIAKGLIKTITGGKTDDELYRLARSSGALQGSIYRENLTPEQIIAKKVKEKTASVWAKLTRPDNILENWGQKFEEMTRLTTFKGALANGKTAQEAAKIARNVTVDFGQSGNTIQAINRLVPFLNARIQGFANLGKAIQRDPTKAVRTLLWSAAYPQAVLTAHNQRYESYQNIPDYEKRKYWVIMVGENKGKDIQGKSVTIPHYIKIPKGEAQQAVANTVERVLTLGQQKYPDTTGQFVSNLIKDISPVTESSILPAGFQQALELTTNYSLFKQKPIEGDWTKVGKKWFETSAIEPKYRTTINTSEVAKLIGNALNWSPVKIDYVLKTGVINDIISVLDIPKLLLGKEKRPLFEKAAEMPLIRGIIGTEEYGQSLQQKKIEQQKLKNQNTKKIEKILK